MVSSNTDSMIERKPRAPVLRAESQLGNRTQSRWQEFQAHAFHAKQHLVLFHQGIFRLGQNLYHRGFIQLTQSGDDW